MGKPTVSGTDLKFATNTNYAGGPDVGTATKSEPAAGRKADGWRKLNKPPAQEFNWWMSWIADWVRFLYDEVLSVFVDDTGVLKADTVDTIQIVDDAVDKDKIAADIAGNGLIQVGSGALEVNPDNSTLTIAADILQVKDDGVTGAKLAPAVAGSGLSQDGSGNLDITPDGVTGAMLAPAVAGDGLVQDGSGNLDVNVDDASIEIDTDVVQVKPEGILRNHLNKNGNLLINPTARRGNAFWWGDGGAIDPDPGYSNSPVWDAVHWTDTVATGSYWKLSSLVTSTQGDVSEKIDITNGVNLTISGEIELQNRTVGSVALAILCYDAGDNHLLTIPITVSADTSSFDTFEATGTTPANTDHIRIWKWVNGLTCDIVAIKEIKIERGTSATVYSDESSMPQYLSAVYSTDAEQTLPDLTVTPINYEDLEFDDPGANRVVAAKAITAFADAGGGQVTVTAAGHGLSEDDVLTIYGTTNYNGSFTATNVVGADFEITDVWAGDDATGFVAWRFVADRYMKLRVNAAIATRYTAWAIGDSVRLDLYKDGSLLRGLDWYEFPAVPGVLIIVRLHGTTIIELNKGSRLHVSVTQETGAALDLDAPSSSNYIDIEEI